MTFRHDFGTPLKGLDTFEHQFLHKYLKEKIINNLTKLKPQTKNTLNRNKEFNVALVST